MIHTYKIQAIWVNNKKATNHQNFHHSEQIPVLTLVTIIPVISLNV